MFRSSIHIAVVCIIAFTATAQEVSPPRIETEGVATIDAIPPYVEFWLHADTTGATCAEAMEHAMNVEPEVRKAIQEHNLSPTDIQFMGFSLPDVKSKEARVSGRLRFSMTSYTTPPDGPKLFAALCDEITVLAASVSCHVEGPILGVEDKDAVEDAAVGRATEKAYPTAKAAAQIMKAQVTSVDKVSVESIIWNTVAGVHATEPTLRRVTCTVRVRVSYTFAPA
jgi:uncharacterized protein YggE